MSVMRRKCLADYLVDEELQLVFVRGLAFDFCVLDNALNAACTGCGTARLIMDASGATHVPQFGSSGDGFRIIESCFLALDSALPVKAALAQVLGPVGGALGRDVTQRQLLSLIPDMMKDGFLECSKCSLLKASFIRFCTPFRTCIVWRPAGQSGRTRGD